jgi:hypothetical protein
VLTLLVGVVVLYLAEPARINQGYWAGFVGSSVIIAMVSFYDDIKNKRSCEAHTQFLAVAAVSDLGSSLT